MHKPKEREQTASPGPTYMSSSQMANYLQDLRTNRPARPTGSRPPPAHFNTWTSRTSSRFAETPAVSPFSHPTFKDAGVDVDAAPQPDPDPDTEPQSHRRTTSNMSIDEVLARGRPSVQPPRGRDVSMASIIRERTPSVQYRENPQRQVEREEARALRIAMEDLEMKDEENLYNSARDEAAELVWKHQHANAPDANPDAPYAYPGLRRKGSHNRSQSLGREGQDLQRANSKMRKRHSMGSSTSRSSSLQSRRAASGSSVTADADFGTSPSKLAEDNGDITALPRMPSDPADTKQRRRSSGSRRKISASLFKNPDDQIYEEPEEETPAPAAVTPAPPAKLPLQMRRNPFSRVQFARNNSVVRANTDPVLGSKRFDRYEIQNNPPSQSRNAGYTANAPSIKPQEQSAPNITAEAEPEVKVQDGKEIRSDDIRAATSMRLKDRSQKLPTPTMVSDSPGRPIVSFKSDWRPKEIELKEEVSSVPASAPRPVGSLRSTLRPLSKASTAPVIPTLDTVADQPKGRPELTSLVPEINVSALPPAPAPRGSRAPAPAIKIYEDSPSRPLPDVTTSRKVNTPPQTTAASVPTINVSQAPLARSRPSPAHPIPTISIEETPSISVHAPSRGHGVNSPSISVTPSVPMISVDGPSPSRAPAINVPSVSVTPSAPSINVEGPTSSTRPLPNPKDHVKQSVPPKINPRSHWTPTANVRSGALCAHCALPISGRIVSAAGSRFHPECFLCHHCGEHLECVAFYPEPDTKRAERVARIRARQRGEDMAFLPTHPTAEDMARLEAEDGFDESARFYCHLDFHELYSPRCKSCKTPIEGEVIVACGAEWHAGHFFCAQCGDPFTASTPFVEKDGYAWCVDCHTNRYSTKCRKCRRPVTDTVVKALGAEWHVKCFVCVQCGGDFGDGRYFLRGDSSDPVCVGCEERRLKA
ncbi:hypothetical protein EJ04DRAFT_472410 [Polyplosphaeria fusca]|uniref:LIM zinc-binding domain-containing protein n=1 Tax=Polyplosphaeria fusca TaxID=682080 RepID=A0A9P4QPA2_9PLEO|nr:hypothetical protein EJ04DRAFT_472410 [Polyplosphaeria fusca]